MNDQPIPEPVSQPTANPYDRLLGRTEWAMAAILTGLMVALHVVRLLYAGPLWRDEIHGFSIANAPSISGVWSLLQKDHLPLGFPLALHAWIGAGGGASDLSLRVFGFLVGIGVIGAVWRTNVAFRQRIPVISLVLVGLSPVIISWGDAIRHYGLSAMLMLLTVGTVWRMTEQPSRRKFLSAAGVAALSVHCAYFNAFLLVAVCFASFTVFLRRRQWTASLLPLAMGAVVALTLMPYLTTVLTVREAATVMRYPITSASVVAQFVRALGSPMLFLALIWLGLMIAGVAVTTWTLLRKQEECAPQIDKANVCVFLSVTMFGGLAAYGCWIGLARFWTYPWHFVPVISLLSVCVGPLLNSAIQSTFSRCCRIGAVVIVSAILLPSCYRQIQVRQSNMDLVADRVQKLAGADDLILINPHYLGISFNRYYKGSAQWSTVPPLDDYRFQGDVRKYMTLEKSLDPLLGQITDTLQKSNKIWLVGDYPFSPTPQPPPELPSSIRTSIQWEGFYQQLWGAQVAYLIQTHALRGGSVRISRPGPISTYENVPVLVVAGWRE